MSVQLQITAKDELENIINNLDLKISNLGTCGKTKSVSVQRINELKLNVAKIVSKFNDFHIDSNIKIEEIFGLYNSLNTPNKDENILHFTLQPMNSSALFKKTTDSLPIYMFKQLCIWYNIKDNVILGIYGLVFDGKFGSLSVFIDSIEVATDTLFSFNLFFETLPVLSNALRQALCHEGNRKRKKKKIKTRQ